MTIIGIIENIIADVIFLLLAILIGWGWVSITRRRNLQAFFGVSQIKRIVVYLSNLRVQTFGAVGIAGRKMSYQGSAVAYGEMRASTRIQRLFSFFIPDVAGSSNFLNRLLISDVNVTIAVSPLTEKDLETSSSIISLGSPAYNIASKFIEDNCGIVKFRFGVLKKKDIPDYPSHFRATAFSTDVEPVIIPSGTVSFDPGLLGQENRKSEDEEMGSAILIEDLPPFEDPINAFMQRTVKAEDGRKLFYLAGLSEHATEGAANYLVSSWHQLHKKYGEETSFIVVLRIDKSNSNKWTVLFDKVISQI